MRSAFFIKRCGIAKGRDLGMMDMRQIAPTLARFLNVQLPDAKQPPVNSSSLLPAESKETGPQCRMVARDGSSRDSERVVATPCQSRLEAVL